MTNDKRQLSGVVAAIRDRHLALISPIYLVVSHVQYLIENPCF
ncbi:MAG: hypothetical protein V7K42_17035 [Nostoc sp.]